MKQSTKAEGKRVVLDANVLVSAVIKPSGISGQILELFLEKGAFELILSKGILEEYKRALLYPKVQKYHHLSTIDIDRFLLSLELLSDVVEEVEAEVWGVNVSDPDDIKYLQAAMEGKAQVLVSGDQHLLTIKEFNEILILTPREFLDSFKF